MKVRASGLAGLALAGGIGAIGTAGRADARPLDTSICPPPTSYFTSSYSTAEHDTRWLQTGPDGTNLASEAAAGSLQWNNVSDYDGATSYPLHWDPPGAHGAPETVLRWNASLPMHKVASSPCNNTATIEFNPLYMSSYLNTPYYMQSVARHEYGHTISLDHTGEQDSAPFTGNEYPTMASGVAAYPYLSADDVGQLYSLWSKQSLYDGTTLTVPLDANQGFADGSQYWYVAGNLAWKFSDTGGAQGGYALIESPNVNSDYIYQDMNVAPEAGRSVSFTGRLSTKMPVAGMSGSILVEVMQRRVNYTSGTDTDPYPSNVDQHHRQPNGAWSTCASRKLTPTNSWTGYSTDPPACTMPSTWTAADTRIRVITALQDSSGANAGAAIDNVRVIATMN